MSRNGDADALGLCNLQVGGSEGRVPTEKRDVTQPALPQDLAAYPALLSFEHLVKLGYSKSSGSAWKMVKAWPPELRAPNTGRRVLFLRDRVFRYLGLLSSTGGE